MNKGLGIAALVVSIVAIFVPFLGTWLTILVAGMAAFASGPGFALAVASLVINTVHIFFFSPLLWGSAGLGAIANEAAREMGTQPQGAPLLILPWLLVGIQIIALAFLIWTNNKPSPSRSGVAS